MEEWGGAEQSEVCIRIMKYIITPITGMPKNSDNRNELRHLYEKRETIRFKRGHCVALITFAIINIEI